MECPMIDHLEKSCITSKSVTTITPAYYTHKAQVRLLQHLWQFLDNQVIHLIIFLPFVCLGIDIESCTSTQLPIIILAFYSRTPRASVRENEGDPLFTCSVKESSFLSTSVLSTGETCEVKEDRNWGIRGSGGRDEDVELRGEGEGGGGEFVFCEEAFGSLVRREFFELNHGVLFKGSERLQEE